jgi:hypothetical protein
MSQTLARQDLVESPQAPLTVTAMEMAATKTASQSASVTRTSQIPRLDRHASEPANGAASIDVPVVLGLTLT